MHLESLYITLLTFNAECKTIIFHIYGQKKKFFRGFSLKNEQSGFSLQIILVSGNVVKVYTSTSINCQLVPSEQGFIGITICLNSSHKGNKHLYFIKVLLKTVTYWQQQQQQFLVTHLEVSYNYRVRTLMTCPNSLTFHDFFHDLLKKPMT